MTTSWEVDTIDVTGLHYEAALIVPAKEPELYSISLLALPDASESWRRESRDQLSMSMRICNYLNGGERPEWLTDFEVCNSNRAISLAGGSITALIRLPDDTYTCDSDKNDLPLAQAMRKALDLLIHLLEEKAV